MVKLVNRAKMTTATTGAGAITLGSAVSGFQTFADAGVADGDAVRYVIEDGADWEIGVGTYTASGTTLSRDTIVESSNAGSAISLSGSATIYVTATAETFGLEPVALTADGSNNVDMDLSLGRIFTFTPVDGVNYTFSFSNVPDAADWKLILTGASIGTSFEAPASFSSQTIPTGMSLMGGDFSPDGLHYVGRGDAGNNYLAWGTLSAPFDFSGYTETAEQEAVALVSIHGVRYGDNGRKLFISDQTRIYSYNLSTPYDPSTANLAQGFPDFYAGWFGAFQDFHLKPDGTKLYFCDPTEAICQITLQSAWDLTSAGVVSSLNTSGMTNAGGYANFTAGPAISDDGTRAYLISSSTDSVAEFDLSTPWDITTATRSALNEVSVGSGSSWDSLFFTPDGEKLFGIADNSLMYVADTFSGVLATFTYPAGVKWETGQVPPAPGDGEVDVIRFLTGDGGSTVQAFVTGDHT